jgi:uncharacterized protein YeaO (DUF488 family)
VKFSVTYEGVSAMVTILTSQIDYIGPDKLDVTVKSGKGCGKVLAPTWELVGGLKHWRRYPSISSEEYVARYYELLRKRYRTNPQPFLDILAQEQRVLVCYCQSDTFCHRHVAVDILEKIALAHHVPFVRGGEL